MSQSLHLSDLSSERVNTSYIPLTCSLCFAYSWVNKDGIHENNSQQKKENNIQMSKRSDFPTQWVSLLNNKVSANQEYSSMKKCAPKTY